MGLQGIWHDWATELIWGPPIFVVQWFNHVRLFVTPWTAAYQASLSFAVSWSLLKLMSIDAIQPSHPLTPFSSCPQSFTVSGSFPVNQLFLSGGQSTGASASASVLPVIFKVDFLLDWLVWSPCCLLSKGLKSLLQHHSLKASILRHSAFFMVQLSLCTWLLEKP